MKFCAALIALIGREVLVVHMALAKASWRVSETLNVVVLACVEMDPLTLVEPHVVTKPSIRTRFCWFGLLELLAPFPNLDPIPKLVHGFASVKLNAKLKLPTVITANNITAIVFFIFVHSSETSTLNFIMAK